jgi:hypothetical protein
MIVFEQCANSKALTILVRGGNKMMVEGGEARHPRRALCHAQSDP